MSSMSGNVTSTSDIPRNSIVSLILRSHAMWLYRPSTDSPTSAVLSSANLSSRDANVMNSVVHTGVKSAGWLNRITQRPA